MRVRILGGLGVVLTVATAAVVVAPDLLADPLAEIAAALESRDPRRLLLGLGVVVGIYAAWTARSGSSGPPPSGGPAAVFEGVGDPPETVTAADTARTGDSFDSQIDLAAAGDPVALASVRSTLAETAEATYARAADRSPEDAARAVETGAWTDDPVAAAFLGGEDAPSFSLPARLREWLDPAAERERRVERTVEAVEAAFESDAATRADSSARVAGDGDRDEDNTPSNGDGGEPS
ncbi:DUF7269 family protein [Halorussus amylolyticus]|uniref:DUF7269 family protein n=1 Tax=Halorussus amylolyticus TaxID=1126242 RepID=UPI00104E4150|nr:hypothetical protein [Halorussus amylolyticus]